MMDGMTSKSNLLAVSMYVYTYICTYIHTYNAPQSFPQEGLQLKALPYGLCTYNSCTRVTARDFGRPQRSADGLCMLLRMPSSVHGQKGQKNDELVGVDTDEEIIVFFFGGGEGGGGERGGTVIDYFASGNF